MNTFGRIFRVSVFGESHGPAIGVVLDGVPAGIALSEEDLTEDIDRRRSGAKGTTPRREADLPEILSGLYRGRTTGAPLAIAFRNTNTKSQDYSLFRALPRPGHADFVAGKKWDGFNDPRGGGHFSGRLTLPLVAAGAVAKKILPQAVAALLEHRGEKLSEADLPVVGVSARLVEVGGVPRAKVGALFPGEEDASVLWKNELDRAIAEGDSLGGVAECTVSGLPVGIGEPFFDSVESMISHLVFAIPGVRGVEFGDGFAAASMKGSEHNDAYVDSGGRCSKNGAGGINGGITNGNDLTFRVAFKPTSSIRKEQTTFDFEKGQMSSFSVPGRHDACFALRTPVVVEAACAIALADLALSGLTSCLEGSSPGH